MRKPEHIFSLPDRTLILHRYPAKYQHVSLRAWDAADEYLIETTQEQAQNAASIAILNDDFGALGCYFADKNIQWINDSEISRLALAQNLVANNLSADSVDCSNALQPIKPCNLVLLKLPRTHALLEHQLVNLQAAVTSDTVIVAAGKVKSVHKSTLALFEKHLGITRTSLAKKKARLIYCQVDRTKISQNPYPRTWPLENSQLKIVNHANVFSSQSLDIGARLLLQHLPDCRGKTVVDLGCGNGVLGLRILELFDDVKLIFVDESNMAIDSVKQSIELNFAGKGQQCQWLLSNCLEAWPEGQPQVNLVLCNPPFHQQNTITDHIAYQMFSDAKRHLKPGGELRIVANRHLDYPQKLKKLFGGYKVIASDRKFSILSAIKS